MHYPQNLKNYPLYNESVIFLPTNFPEEPKLIVLPELLHHGFHQRIMYKKEFGKIFI